MSNVPTSRRQGKPRQSIPAEAWPTVLAEYQDGATMPVIAASYNVSIPTVSRVLHLQGVPVRKRKQLNPEEQRQLVALYENGTSSNKLSEQFGISFCAIFGILKKHKAKIRTTSASKRLAYPFREDAFADPTNDREAAYWAGFLMADGNIHLNEKRGYWKIQLGVQERDGQHIHKFKKFLEAPHKIVVTISHDPRKQPQVRLAVTSERMASDLAACGVIPRKSTREKVANHLTMNADFWRGVIDGDGSVALAVSRTKYRSPRIALCGSLALTGQFLAFSYQYTQPQAKPRLVKGAWTISFQGKPAITMISLLYENATVYLDRKRESAFLLMEEFKYLSTQLPPR